MLQGDTQHPHKCTQTSRHANANMHTNTDGREYPRGHTSITDAQDALRRATETLASTQTPPCARARCGTPLRAHTHACPRAAAPPPAPATHLCVDRGQRLDWGQGVGAGHAEAADGDSTGRGKEAADDLGRLSGTGLHPAALAPAPG